MSHWRGTVVSYLSFWAFSMLLVALLFSRGKAAQAFIGDTTNTLAQIAAAPIEADSLSGAGSETAFASESADQTAMANVGIRRYYSSEERSQIRHARIRIPD